MFLTWTTINVKRVSKYLPVTQGTVVVHLDRGFMNLQSTKGKIIGDDTDTSPLKEIKNYENLAAYISRYKNGTVYTDLTGFPATSMQGSKYLLFLYHYSSNAIIIRPLKIDQMKKY